jgi:hypothetical protein
MSFNEITVPTFFLTYWRPWEEKSNVVDSFLDYARDTSISKFTSESIGKFIQSSSVENIRAINNLGSQIGLGVDYLRDIIKKTSEDQIIELKNIKREISLGLSNISNELLSISLKLELIIARLDASNLLLKDITKLLRVPDSEKERQKCIELGLKFFISADKDEDLYDDSLNQFLKAEKLMPQDYFTLYYIGLIYLLSPKHINIEIANSYFNKSGKYGFVESLNDSLIYENVLNKDSFGDNKNLSSNKQLINKITSAAFEKTAYSYYILGDYINALKFQQKALEVEQSAKNYFFLSKYQNRNSLISESCNSINKCLDMEPKSIISIFSDLDLISSNEILDIVNERNINLNIKIDVLKNDFLLIAYLDSSDQIISLEESKSFRFDRRLDSYNLALERKKQILDIKSNEEKERIKVIEKEISDQKKIEEIAKFENDKLIYYQEYIFKELYKKHLILKQKLILEKIECVVKEEAFKGLSFNLSEKIEAYKYATMSFSTCVYKYSTIEMIKYDAFKLILINEYDKFRLNDKNLIKINEEFDLVYRISFYHKKNINTYDFNYAICKHIDFVLEKKSLIFNDIGVKSGLRFIANSLEFKKNFCEEIKNTYYNNTTTKYYKRYLELALNVYLNEVGL